MLNHLNITLYGKVQGVFLRRTIEHEAKRKGIAGFVRNEPDGSVYIEAEGEENNIEKNRKQLIIIEVNRNKSKLVTLFFYFQLFG